MPARNLLIPVRKCTKQPGRFRWPAKAILAAPRPADALPLGQLAADLRGCGVRARVALNAFGPAAVRIRRDPTVAGDEAYRLTVAPDGIEIAVSADAGAYYAVQTLRELLTVHGRTMPCCQIDDRPDFPRRGVYHDCSRGKVPTVKTVKALVERLARWKINELQLYIENVFTFRRHPAIGRGYSPYTPEDILDIQEHCKLHHVRFVGSLASFGHMERILQLPAYRRLGELPGTHGWRAGTTLCPTDPGSIRLVGDLYDEFLPLLEAVDFNACCDETWELGKGRSKKRADRVGVGRLYLDFILKLHRLAGRHGKRLNVWCDIVLEHPELLAEVPSDMVMLNWDYAARGSRISRTKEIAAAGLPCVVCPGTSSWQTHGTLLDNAIGNVANFAAEGRRRGAEGLLNTDWGDCGHRNFLGVSLHGFAHGGAHAWNGRDVDDRKFTERFCLHAFGQTDGRLAASIKALGSAHKLLPQVYGTVPYHALVEPLAGPGKGDRESIGLTRPAGLRKLIDRLKSPRLWPKPAAAPGRFEAVALKEFALAARMDCLAAKRSLAGLRLRAGQHVGSAELRKLAAETRAVTSDFRRLWLTRNRPSRLRDNLKPMRAAAAESARLAKK